MTRNNVHILPPDIISKIAAGEVIERPASIVKELVENALDAEADSIDVTLTSAGKTMIKISDTGSGIAKEDLEKLFSRHATSKIATIDDLYNIQSLGFRGEALYSIGAVSDVVISSTTAGQECGWQAHVRGNETIARKPCNRRAGTEITVQELFFNTPARRKFLKSNAAELNAIIDAFLPYTLLFPENHFSLSNDGKRLISLHPAKGFIPRAANALNLKTDSLLEDTVDIGAIRIHLVLGDINIQRARKDMQFVFVNGRPVENRSISFHINEIYRLLLAPGIFPFFCAYLTIPAQDIDVNVHPAKREVKIKDDLKLIGLLRRFCERLLMTRSKARQAQNIFSVPEREIVCDQPQTQYQTALAQSIALFKTEATQEARGDLKEKLMQARYLGNLLRKYLLFETDDSLLLIDQHAAQERITFERLKNQLEKGAVEIQPLLAPITVALSAQELVSWKENKNVLEKTGYEITLFDKETLAVHAHPALITDVERSVRNLLGGEPIARMESAQIARMACRSSVMFGFAMNPEQAEFQRKNLLLCADPFTCPHGRPTVIEIKEETLRKQFLRT